MRRRSMEDFHEFDQNGTLVLEKFNLNPSRIDPANVKLLPIDDGPSEEQGGGDLDGTEDGDLYELTLLAGQTYSFSMRPGTMTDPLLAIFDSTLTNVLAVDDEGGLGHASIITFTPTTDGTYYLYATAWGIQVTGDPTADTGTYQLDFWTPESSPDAGDTMGTATEIEDGSTTFGHFTSTTDVDLYKIDLTSGLFYSFAFAGGVGAAGELTEPGSVPAKVELLDAGGNVVAVHNINTKSGVGFQVTDGGTYYVRLTPTNNKTGGYTLDVDSVDLSTKSPLEAFNWDSAANIVDSNGSAPGGTAYVYFANAGEHFGVQQGDNGADGIPNSGDENVLSLGWNDFEKQQVMLMLEQYEFITGINYEITTDASEATFRLITTTAEPYGARFFPNDADVYGDQVGVGLFNIQSHAWTFDSNGPAPGSQQSLLQGGWAWELLLHEFGHGHGIAHPHDTGGGSEIMAGVFASQGSFGAYNLNQSVYSVMSYNSSWVFHPNGPTPFSVSSLDNGSSGGLNPFDIAILQQRYGVIERNTGNDVYTLIDVKADAEYRTIWDSGGNDTIAYGGPLSAQIDLIAATLDYSPTGGGVVSFLMNPAGTPAAQLIRGGYLIANGVVIENATGGSGHDILLGNAANNVLTGNAGNDTLGGRTGIDVYKLGAGADTAIISLDSSKVDTKVGSVAYDLITDFDGTSDKIDFSDLDAKTSTAANDAFTWIGTSANKSAGQLSYKVYDSVNGAEKALGIEIDNFTGAHSGKVTVVLANVDGGGVDYAVVLLGAPVLNAADFVF